MSICMMYDSFKKMTIPLLLDFGTHVSIGGGGGGGGGGGWGGLEGAEITNNHFFSVDSACKRNCRV
jgi:hypothetical protein